MKKEINSKINDLVLAGYLPAPFYEAQITSLRSKDENKMKKIYSRKYKQVILPEYPSAPISRIL